MPSIGEAFQRSTKEKEQAEECTFIIEPFLSIFSEPQKSQKSTKVDRTCFCVLLYYILVKVCKKTKFLSSSLEIIEHRGTERTEHKSNSVHSVPLCSNLSTSLMNQIVLAA